MCIHDSHNAEPLSGRLNGTSVENEALWDLVTKKWPHTLHRTLSKASLTLEEAAGCYRHNRRGEGRWGNSSLPQLHGISQVLLL